MTGIWYKILKKASAMAIGFAIFGLAPSTALAQPVPPAGAVGQVNPQARAIMHRGFDAATARNFTAARVLYIQACLEGAAYACTIAGEAHTNADWGPQSAPEALRYWTRGCDLGSAISCLSVALRMRVAANSPQMAQVRNFYKRACDGGNAMGCNRLAVQHYLGEGGPVDFVEAGRVAEFACNNNVGDACSIVGALAEKGQGRAIDLAAARSSYQRGCTLNSGVNCFNFAIMSSKGSGGAKDEPAARVAFEKSCTLQYWSGCDSAGQRHYRGEGGPANLVKARELFTLACTNANENGCRNQIAMLRAGEGGPTDLASAYAVSERRCVNGAPANICGTLGSMVFNGHGTVANKVRGRALITAACTANDQSSCSALAGINAMRGITGRD